MPSRLYVGTNAASAFTCAARLPGSEKIAALVAAAIASVTLGTTLRPRACSALTAVVRPAALAPALIETVLASLDWNQKGDVSAKRSALATADCVAGVICHHGSQAETTCLAPAACALGAPKAMIVNVDAVASAVTTAV